MAQIRPRRIEPKAAPKPLHNKTEAIEWIALAITLLAGGIPFAICKYTEFSLPGPFDSGAYVYAAESLLQGRQIGSELEISAQPATLLANLAGVWLFGFNETGPKLIQMLMQLGALAMMYLTLRKLYGLPAAVVGTCIAAIYLSAPLIAKYGNVKEQFMISVMVMGICCVVQYQYKGGWWRAVLAGALLIDAFYFKATGTSAGIAVFGYLVIRAVMKRCSLRSFGIEVVLLLTGAIAGLIPLIAFFAWQGRMDLLRQSLPVMVVQFLILLVILVITIVLLIRLVGRYQILKRLNTVHKGIWLAGMTAIVLMLGVALFLVYRAEEGTDQNAQRWADVASYLRNHPLAYIPNRVWNGAYSIYHRVASLATGTDSYLGNSRAAWSLQRQAAIVFRYYGALKLPVFLALFSTGAAIVVSITQRKSKAIPSADSSVEGRVRNAAMEVVPLFTIWWILDMAFVWISPRSYEEYYLPLNASAAMTGGFLLGWYRDKFRMAASKGPWLAAGAAAGMAGFVMVWPIFVGLSYSPFSGTKYENPSRGYAQRLEEVRQRRQIQPPWERIGQDIRRQTKETDQIFVWGWYPGIYVQAQRLSPVAKAFESDMHVMNPLQLSREAYRIVRDITETPTAFIVDSRKREFPWDREPLELWPIVMPNFLKEMPQGGFLPTDPAVIKRYETVYRAYLEKKYGVDEAQRFEALEPLRAYIRQHYIPVNNPDYVPHVVLKAK